ncbi:MAG: Gx transporter family protein [Lachnospiraceae bacterium]|nr:Gx transporter family protein [Lachnospiraceae bacterium]
MIALAMILSYVESLVPTFGAVPGMKLGLTNIVVLFALYCIETGSAVGINLLRVFCGNAFGSADRRDGSDRLRTVEAFCEL